MNRKGKKSSLIKAENAKAASKRKANSKSPGLFGFKRNSAETKKTVKPPQKRLKTKAIADHDSKLKNLTTKSNPTSLSPKKIANNQARKLPKTLKLATYTITIAVGLSTIFGTIASIANSFQTSSSENSPVTTQIEVDRQNQAKLDSLFEIASLGKEISSLKSELQELADQYPDLKPEIFLVDLDNKGFVSIKGNEIIASASTIKLPVLVAFFQDVDRGKISLEEQLTMTKNVIADGSGNMQYEKPGTKFSALETAEKMMTISDNTATNMLIERLGGMEQVNLKFNKMGLKETKLKNPLPDLTGTNTTSPEDLGNLLVKIDGGKLISLRSRDRLFYIMRNIVRNTLLPEGLEPEAIIAHKTGDIKSVLGDVGIVDMPSGKRYIASILVKRPDNSPQAKEFIQKASGTVYQYFKNPQTSTFPLEDE